LQKQVFAKQVYDTLAKTNKFLFRDPKRFCLQTQVIAKRSCVQKNVFAVVASPERGILKNLSPGKFVPENVLHIVASFWKWHPNYQQS
jgi:hypothetical protein